MIYLKIGDAGRISKNITNRFPWTTNNFTERIIGTIEAVYSGKQTLLTFIERMYKTKFRSKTIVNHEDLNKFESGLVTLFNTQTIEQQIKDDIVCSDKVRRLNQGRLDFLLNMKHNKKDIEVVNEAKENLVHYFCNKERVVPASLKNNIIYQGGVEDSYQEIIRFYNVQYKIRYLK
ncbi:hypothetical protein GLOIN_2v1662765 [Rhizophagus clarus]|uniref:Uncharacterized protein n=1 Tax=Rhizophagus clarus TaxID=94130 RepID=A0A8H3L796_9GLOM|nr:hypothetical protein GLOIN_2v1662765 [Rhizophagus clarus]